MEKKCLKLALIELNNQLVRISCKSKENQKEEEARRAKKLVQNLLRKIQGQEYHLENVCSGDFVLFEVIGTTYYFEVDPTMHEVLEEIRNCVFSDTGRRSFFQTEEEKSKEQNERRESEYFVGTGRNPIGCIFS